MLLTCAPITELPSNTSTMVDADSGCEESNEHGNLIIWSIKTAYTYKCHRFMSCSHDLFLSRRRKGGLPVVCALAFELPSNKSTRGNDRKGIILIPMCWTEKESGAADPDLGFGKLGSSFNSKYLDPWPILLWNT